ncbi:MAG: ABC transporter permease [Thermoanaerobaculia bacterium]
MSPAVGRISGPSPGSWRTIARRELLEVVVSPTFAWTFAVSSILILLAFWVGGRQVLLESRRAEAARAADLRRFAGETDWQAVTPSVGLPPLPMAGLVAGVVNDLGRVATVEGRGAIEATDSWYGSEPVAALLRVLDLEFVIRVVLSLFALLLGHDVVCGERERGTLRLVFASGLKRASFLGGKIAGALAALLLPLAVPLGLGALLLRFLGVPMGALDWQRLGLVVLSGLLYVAAFLALATWISTWTRRPGDAFLLALSAWVVLVLVVPRAAVSLAARALPVLSRDEIQSERSRLQSQLFAGDRENFRQVVEVMAMGRGDGESVADRMAKINQMMEKQASERDRRLRELDRGLAERRRAAQGGQRALAFGLARLSPAATFTLAAEELAGTSLALADDFAAQLARYQEELGRFQEAKTGGRGAGGGMRIKIKISEHGEGDADDGTPQPVDLAEMPVFVWQPPPLAPAIERALPDLALLAGFALLCFAGSFVSFQKYDLR